MTGAADAAGSVDVSVVICAYTTDRCDDLDRAVRSVLDDGGPLREIVLVTDHHDELLDWARRRFPEVRVTPNRWPRGLAGARNTGIAEVRGEVVAFLDDDAAAEPGWVAGLARHYRDPAVWGVGGAAHPVWPAGRPRWFPPEFDWVVGCSYVGLPTHLEAVRNVIGANMSYRRAAFARVGGFTVGLGRIGSTPLGCEETEFGIRVRDALPEARFLYDPLLGVRHRVGVERTSWRYFRRRCYAEGVSKAAVTRIAGARAGLATERRYVRVVLPRGVVRAATGASARTNEAGLATTAAGYLRGRWGARVADAAPAPRPVTVL